MRSSREWQGYWEGREATRWKGPIKNLREKIPTFIQEVFCLEKGINKYKDVIVREPISQVGSEFEFDLGYAEALTLERIPIETVRNDYKSRLFRGREQGYKLVEHHQVLDDMFAELSKHASPARIPDIESLEATMRLSIYGARMHIEFLLPHYKRDSYSLKVTCRNSVDKKFALTINLSLHTDGATEADIPFDGFHHIHTQELDDEAISRFMSNALRNFLYGTWITDEVDFDQFEKLLHKNLTPNQRVLITTIIKPQKGTRKKASILRFLEILSMLFDEGRDIFRNQEQKLTKLAILTKELHELAEETGTQQLFT